MALGYIYPAYMVWLGVYTQNTQTPHHIFGSTPPPPTYHWDISQSFVDKMIVY